MEEEDELGLISGWMAQMKRAEKICMYVYVCSNVLMYV